MDENLLKQMAENGIQIAHLEGRMKKIENTVEEIRQLTSSVNILANNMANMLEEQKEQNERLSKLESAPADNWKNLTKTVVSTLVGIILGYIFTKLGI